MKKRQIMVLTVLAVATSLPVFSGEYSEQSLRTLFTSPQQRQEIDSNRTAGTKAEGQTIVGPSSVQINGIVKRSDGKNVVWVNGKSTIDGESIDGIKVYSGNINSKNKIPVMVDGKRVYLKPGESWSAETGVSSVGD
ncbi:MAG: hypothetical protein OEZ38_12210 [Gammaproteobacteria bacterium]|nr:hypothetical protein [Gammaproteobacteria bacterium]